MVKRVQVKTETVDVGIIIAKEVPTARCITYCGSISKEPKIKYKNGIQEI